MMFYFRIMLAIIRTCHDWPRLLANRILTKVGLGSLAPSVETISLRNGMRFTMGPSQTIGGADLFLIWEIWTKHSYFIEGRDGFQIHADDTVFDIGANRGYFSAFAAQKACRGKVFAFEPSPENFSILEENLKLNDIANVFAEPMAVSSSRKTVDLYLTPGDEAGNSMHIATGTKISVPSVDLWSYCLEKKIQRIDFLKIDCEGEEYEILRTLPEGFWAMTGKVSMEYHLLDERDPAELVRILKQHNFTILVFDGKYIKAEKVN